MVNFESLLAYLMRSKLSGVSSQGRWTHANRPNGAVAHWESTCFVADDVLARQKRNIRSRTATYWRSTTCQVSPLRPVAENAALVVGVVQLGAERGPTVASANKDRPGRQHTHGRRDKIDPQGMPVACESGGTKRSRGVHTHPGQGCFKRDVQGLERADQIGRVLHQALVVCCQQYRDHQDKRDG